MAEEESPWEFNQADSFAVKELKDTFLHGGKDDIIRTILMVLNDDDEKVRDLKMTNIHSALQKLGIPFPTDAEVLAVVSQSKN